MASSSSRNGAEGGPGNNSLDGAVVGPPAPRYHDPKRWKLISQGAEARLWLVPSLVSVSVGCDVNGDDESTSVPSVCKERFPKSYRHPDLDAQITKSRTKAEARCLVRCRRGGVPCPAVLGVDVGVPGSSSCLFLEYIDGTTVREYLERRSHSYPLDVKEDRKEADVKEVVGGEKEEPQKKRSRLNGDDEDPYKHNDGEGVEKAMGKNTRIDSESLSVASAIGGLVALMHNVNVVHGDLTTSNVMMRNPPPWPPSDGKAAEQTQTEKWKPNLVLIDFGLAGTAGSKGVSHEEKAVDLYVLERAFEATHPGSKELVDEILRVYKGQCKTSDSVLQRLGQVRLRGRKRECFG